MGHKRNGLRRVLLVSSGVVLVGVFLAWMVIRNQEVMEPIVGMGSALGWVAHFAAILVLFAGVTLIARGLFFRGAGNAEEVDR